MLRSSDVFTPHTILILSSDILRVKRFIHELTKRLIMIICATRQNCSSEHRNASNLSVFYLFYLFMNGNMVQINVNTTI